MEHGCALPKPGQSQKVIHKERVGQSLSDPLDTMETKTKIMENRGKQEFVHLAKQIKLQ
jgi:hypothetical protein